LVLGALTLGYAVAYSADERKPVGDSLLFPPERAVLLSGSFDVIWKGEESRLEVDGRPRDWEPFQPPIHVAHLRLSPGLHTLTIGDQRRELVVALNEEEHDGPEDWPLLHRHQMNAKPNRCGDCHETSKNSDRTVVGELRSPEACLECHQPVDFGDTHSHPLEPIEHCEMCHSLHGSSRKGLLKAPVKKLCTDCHDA
jgi:predicted CXXCH cytochrome family protein